ncbi:FUSC family protein [Flavobacterium sp. ST-75]|uniref:FUSC family protein n=1 Tax=Flavobacterium rhizophilum TaxID=3163296 RepID=A0ABW8YD52_9FLAO
MAASLQSKRTAVKARKNFKEVVALNDNPWRWGVGLEAAIAMGIPLLAFYFSGHLTLGFISSLGGLTALHCPQLKRKERAVVLPVVILAITFSSLLGAYMATDVWLKMLCIVLVTIIGCVFMIGLRLGPPGPLMMVLVAAVTGKIASSSAPEVQHLSSIMYPLLVGLGAFAGYVVIVFPLFFKKFRKPEYNGRKFNEIFSGLKFDEVSRAITLRIVTGVTLAVLMAWVFKEERIYWMVLPVIAVLQAGPSVRLTVIKSVHRMIGSLLGVLLYGIILLINPQGLGLVLTVLILQFGIEVVVMRNYGLALMFITPLALTIASIGHNVDMVATIQARVLDTLIGIVIALLVFFVFEKTKFRTQ